MATSRAEQRPLRTVCYCRVSSQGQRDADTIAAQRHDLPLDAERAGEIVVAIIEDNGLSGMTSDRPGIQRVLAMAQRGEFDVLRVRALDRIMRADDEESAVVYAKINRANIAIATPSQKFNAGSARDTFVASIFRALAALDRSELLEKTKAGRRRTARKGGYSCGRMPYGYRWDAVAGAFAIVEEEAKVVRRMFALSRTLGIQAVAYELNKQGYRTRPVLRCTKANEKRESRPRIPGIWDGNAVRRILRSPMYRGERILKFSGEAPIVQSVPAIIAPDLWDEVQERKRQRTPERKTKHSREHLCQRLIKCGVCGFAVYAANARADRTYAYYRCSLRHQWHKKGRLNPCTLPYMRVTDIDAAVWRTLVDVMSDPARIAIAAKLQKQPTADWRAELEAAQRALTRLAAQKSEVLDLLDEDLLDAEECRARLDKLNTRKQQITERMALANQHLASASEKKAVERQLTDLSAEFRQLALRQVPYALKRELLKRFVSPENGGEIVLNADGSVEILGRLPIADSHVPLKLRTAANG